jgi:hypothetical protein
MRGTDWIKIEHLYPPSQKTMDVSPWMNVQGGPSEARRAKEGASADCAEEMKDTTGVNPWRLHFCSCLGSSKPHAIP